MVKDPASQPTKTERKKQPNSRYCFVCGLENERGLQLHFYEIGPGEVEAAVVVPEVYQGYPGIVHGGIIAAMLDEVLARAAMVDDPNHFRVTAKIEITYRNPVPTGEPLHLYATVKRQRGRLAFSHAELRLQDGTLGAEAEGILADLPAAPIPEDQLKALGWKVYPEGPE